MPAANTALITGEAHVLFNALPAVMPIIKDNKVRPLAVTSAKPVKLLPDVPTVGASVPGYAVTGWLGIGVPNGTSPDIIAKLNKEMNALLTDREMLTRLANIGSEPLSGSPADFERFIAAETEKWAKVVQYANLKVN